MIIISGAINDNTMINITPGVARSIAHIDNFGCCIININVLYIVNRAGRRNFLDFTRNRISYNPWTGGFDPF